MTFIEAHSSAIYDLHFMKRIRTSKSLFYEIKLQSKVMSTGAKSKFLKKIENLKLKVQTKIHGMYFLEISSESFYPYYPRAGP